MKKHKSHLIDVVSQMSPTKYVGVSDSPEGASRALAIATAVVGVALLILGAIGTGFVAAQDVEINETYGGSSDADARSMVETSDGGFAIVGETDSFDSSKDMWLIKTDANGNEKFNRTFSGSDRDSAYSVTETSDGGLAIAGFTRQDGESAWLIKTDAEGNKEFGRTFGGLGLDSASSVIETKDGGFAVAVRTNSFSSGSDTDAGIIKTDQNGDMEFSKTFGGKEDDVAWSIIETSDGGFVMAGSTESFGSEERDAWIIKTDEDGNEEYNETFGGTNDDSANSVVQTSGGGYALGGFTESFGSNGWDMWLIKTDEEGNEELSETYGGPNNDSATSIVETTDGGFALAGITDTSLRGTEGNGWLVKTDQNGNMEFSKTFGGSSTDAISSVVETSSGGYALAGVTESFGSGDSNAWLLKLSPSEDDGENEASETDDGEGEDNSAESGGEGLPGFTVVTALLAIGSVIAAIGRQEA